MKQSVSCSLISHNTLLVTHAMYNRCLQNPNFFLLWKLPDPFSATVNLHLHQKGSTKLFVNNIKSIVAYRLRVFVTVLKNDLPNSKVCVKIESVLFNKLPSISTIAIRKTDPSVAFRP